MGQNSLRAMLPGFFPASPAPWNSSDKLHSHPRHPRLVILIQATRSYLQNWTEDLPRHLRQRPGGDRRRGVGLFCISAGPRCTDLGARSAEQCMVNERRTVIYMRTLHRRAACQSYASAEHFCSSFVCSGWLYVFSVVPLVLFVPTAAWLHPLATYVYPIQLPSTRKTNQHELRHQYCG